MYPKYRIYLSSFNLLNIFFIFIIFFLDPPVFVEEQNMIQFGKLGENITLKFVVHTVSIIKCCHIEGENRAKRRPNIIFTKNITHLFHGTDTITKELEITFRFTELQTSDYQKYNITVCNHDGNSSCIVELKPMNTGKNTKISMLSSFKRNLVCS